MTVRAVGFDLDDTLAVPERERAAILREAARAADATRLPDREGYLRAHARNEAAETREPIFADLLADGDPAAATRRYREATAEALVPVDGAADLFDSLRSAYNVGLLTDGPARAQRSKLQSLGWTGRFDAVVVTGELGARKPSGRAFSELLAGLDADPTEAVYVGDDPERDVAGASAAGLRAVQVLGPGEDPDPRADAHLRRDALATELPALLRSFD